ncbi:MAG: hypothetical protein HYX24_05390 [Candidatus Aenigmarchaeota archaeon]|nr:hypothetical protein [Candidatus Aenigmarchaeota archaeon]
MTSAEEHSKTISEFVEDINEKIRDGKLYSRQKIIGFDVSECATNLFEFYLHRKGLVTQGFSVNHRYFSSPQKAEEKFPFDFPKKEGMLNLLVEIEALTTRLCYGKSKKLEDAENAVQLLFRFKETVEGELGEAI